MVYDVTVVGNAVACLKGWKEKTKGDGMVMDVIMYEGYARHTLYTHVETRYGRMAKDRTRNDRIANDQSCNCIEQEHVAMESNRQGNDDHCAWIDWRWNMKQIDDRVMTEWTG
jgi:hypothetical protein